MALHGSASSAPAANSITYSQVQQVGASKVLGNPTGSPANVSEISIGGGLTFSGSTLSSAVEHPGYMAGNWYCPLVGGIGAGTAIGAAGSVRLVPFSLLKAVRIQALGARVTTVSASGNFQLAIYANNATTGRPTGTALASTASMSTTTATVVSGAVTQVTLQPGTYWMAVNQDNTAAAYTTVAATSPQMTALVGSATIANIFGLAASTSCCVSTPVTFGTWSDLTSATFTEVANATNAIVLFQAV